MAVMLCTLGRERVPLNCGIEFSAEPTERRRAPSNGEPVRHKDWTKRIGSMPTHAVRLNGGVGKHGSKRGAKEGRKRKSRRFLKNVRQATLKSKVIY